MASAIQRVQGRNGTFWTRLRKAFADAKAAEGRLAVFNRDRREPVYASTDEQEYWAEGAQAWFDCANRTTPAGWPWRADVKQKDPESRRAAGGDLRRRPLAVCQDDRPKSRRHAPATPGGTGPFGGPRRAAIPLSGLQREQLAAGHRARATRGRSSRRAVTLFPAVPIFPAVGRLKWQKHHRGSSELHPALLPTQSLN